MPTDCHAKITAIIGLSKNAGKTTYLNHLLAQHEGKVCGVFSTGRDGEEKDLVFANPKPPLKIGIGTYFCCDTKHASRFGSSATIITRLSQHSASGQLWLLKAESPLETEITGPANCRGQAELAQEMLALGIEQVFIDGSLDRKSIVINSAIDDIHLVVGAGFGSLDKIREEVKRLYLLTQVPLCHRIVNSLADADSSIHVFTQHGWQDIGISSLIGHFEVLQQSIPSGATTLYVPGAVTESMVKKLCSLLKAQGLSLLVRHPLNLHLGWATLSSLLGGFTIETVLGFHIKRIALNAQGIGSVSIPAHELRNKLRQDFVDIDVMDVMEIYEQ